MIERRILGGYSGKGWSDGIISQDDAIFQDAIVLDDASLANLDIVADPDHCGKLEEREL